MDEILCLACDKTLEIPQFVDTDNYDGQLVCSSCKALLYVKLTKGKLRKYKIVDRSRSREQKLNIVVKDEESKQLIQQVGKRTGKLVEGGGTQRGG